MNNQAIIGSVIVIGIVLIGSLLLRELFTWYWKTTKIANTLDNIEKLLEEIKMNTSGKVSHHSHGIAEEKQ